MKTIEELVEEWRAEAKESSPYGKGKDGTPEEFAWLEGASTIYWLCANKLEEAVRRVK